MEAFLEGAGRIHLANRRGRSWARACRLVDLISAKSPFGADLTDLEDIRELSDRIRQSDVLINASSVGMGDAGRDLSPLSSAEILKPPLFVADVIYNPRKTKLLRDAEKQGCRTSNGLTMLLHQGAAAFALWTKKKMPLDLVRSRYFQENPDED